MNLKRILFHVIRILIGFVFILSGILKLLSIDVFELYIYGQGFFSFNVSAVLARLIIGFELGIGTLLIIGFYFRQVVTVTVFTLAIFSTFLVTKLFASSSDENCNCFGDYLELNPAESLFKNIILLILLIFIRKQPSTSFKYKSSIAIVICTAAITIPAVVSAPDFLMSWKSSGIDWQRSSELIRKNEELQRLNISEGKKLVCFFSISCKYCELASKKISVMANEHDLQNNIFYIFTGKDSDLEEFWKIGGSDTFPYTFLKMGPFFKIAGPTVPSVFLLENGNVINQYHYRNINEKEIMDFFDEN